MSRQFNHDPLSDQIKRQLAELRKRLEERGEWPDTADHLLQHLTESGRPATAEDEDMLSLVVNDALQGVDIIKQYRAFYRKLLIDAELRQAFLDALDLLERSEAGELIQPPQMPVPDLSFLKRAIYPTPIVEHPTIEKWRVSWQLLQEQLTHLFTPVELAYRSDHLDLEDKSTVLLRSQVELDDIQLDVLLEAVRPVDEPDHLHLHLSTASLTEAHLPAMQALLQWGEVKQTAVIDKYGRVRFRPLPLEKVLDDVRQTFRADLQLVLEVGNKS